MQSTNISIMYELWFFQILAGLGYDSKLRLLLHPSPRKWTVFQGGFYEFEAENYVIIVIHH